jgi:hypothetical protein
VLLVGESAPASGRHYYRANSILFGAVREAAVRVHGRRTPSGEAFLAFARDAGIWLVDFASKPVNKLESGPRRRGVESGGHRIAKNIRDADPLFVVAVKATIAVDACRALRQSGSPAEFVGLNFPVGQWREGFVGGLASVLRRSRRAAIRTRRRIGPGDA